MTTVYGHIGTADGPFVYFTIPTRKTPIAEVYSLRQGYLVLVASCTGGYSRKMYKTSKTAVRAGKEAALTYARLFFSEVDYKYEP